VTGDETGRFSASGDISGERHRGVEEGRVMRRAHVKLISLRAISP
jgi:hypothetical protein